MGKVDGSAILAAIGKSPGAAKAAAYDQGSSDDVAAADKAAAEFVKNPSCESFLAALTLCKQTEETDEGE